MPTAPLTDAATDTFAAVPGLFLNPRADIRYITPFWNASDIEQARSQGKPLALVTFDVAKDSPLYELTKDPRISGLGMFWTHDETGSVVFTINNQKLDDLIYGPRQTRNSPLDIFARQNPDSPATLHMNLIKTSLREGARVASDFIDRAIHTRRETARRYEL